MNEMRLRQAAVEYAEMEEQIGMYADDDKRMDDEKRAWRERARANLRDAARAFAEGSL